MEVRPYILPGTTRLRTIQHDIEVVLDAWASDWGVDNEYFSVDCVQALADVDEKHYRSPEFLFCSEQDEHKWLSISYEGDLYKSLGAQLINNSSIINDLESKENGIVGDVISDAIYDFAMRILKTPSQSVSEASRDNFYKTVDSNRLTNVGSGAVAVCCEIKDKKLWVCMPQQSLQVVLDDELLISAESVNTKQALTAISASISDQQVVGKVLLGSSKINVGALSSMQVGDVIQLEKLLNEPLEIQFGQSQVICKGFIGKHADSFAVQIDSVVK